VVSDQPPDPAPADPEAAEDRIARARARRAEADDDDHVPRLPRGRGFKLSRGQLIKIVLTAGLLVMLLVVQRPCAESVSTFVTGFGDRGSASQQMPKPGNVERTGSDHYEVIRTDMTEAEIKAAMARARAAHDPDRGTGSQAPASP